jgi:KaiC/GvpD/RAD55 family RecA-like ATPase
MGGQKQCSNINQKRKKLVIVEGEIDRLSVYQIAVDKVKGTKYGDMRPFVVNLMVGAGNAVENIIHNEDFVGSFEQIILAFDSDSATEKEKTRGIVRGKECTEAVASHLLNHNLFVGEYPDGCKDANDALMEDKGNLLYDSLFFKAKKYIPEKIITAKDIDFERLIAPKVEGIYIPTFPLLMDKIHGFRKKELALICSLSGSGKTTISSEIAFHLANSGQRVGIIFLEENEEESEQRMMARYLEVNYNKFKFNPKNYKTIEELKKAYNWTIEDDRFVFLDHFGSLPVNELIPKIKAMQLIHKVDYILFDHLSMAISGNESQNERKDLDMIMTELAAYVSSNDVGIIAVSHLNREASDEIRGISKMKEPMWIKVKKENLRGSSALEQLSWIIIGVDVELMPDGSRGRVRLTTLKNRPWGYLGNADILKMNEETGILEDASDDSFDEDY